MVKVKALPLTKFEAIYMFGYNEIRLLRISVRESSGHLYPYEKSL